MKNVKGGQFWKPVGVDDEVSKDLQTLGFAGFEELTNYNLDIIQNQDGPTDVTKRKKKRKKRRIVKQREKSQSNINTRKRKHEEEPGFFVKKIRTSIPFRKPEVTSGTLLEDTGGDEGTKSDPITVGMEAWYGLNVPDPVIRALAERGFTKPTQIQSLTLPPAIMGKRDILGAAETGSGKTLAFGIPIIHGILQYRKKEVDLFPETNKDINCESNSCDVKQAEQNGSEFVNSSARKRTSLFALVLTPTRELAIQVKNHLVAAAKYTSIKVAVVVGGLASEKQERLLKKHPEIVVATPGRLWELIREGNPHLSQIDDIKFLAIDETDRMLEKGHFEELHNLLERINLDENKKRRRQNFVLSATLTLVHEPPKHLKHRVRKRLTPGQKLQTVISLLGITDPKVVDITQERGTASSLLESRVCCPLEQKDMYLYYLLLRHPGRTLVFCNSVTCVRRLTQLFTLLQCQPLPLHANMEQRQRLRNLERFQKDPCGVLLATDVAARGLDIPDVEHVVHYQVPRTSESYVHRSGRTARAQKEGLSVLLIEPAEVSYYARLCRTLGREKDLPVFPVDDALFSAVKERVLLARELDKLDLVVRRHRVQNSWFQKAVKDMDMVVDENEMPRGLSTEASAEIKRAASLKRKQLNALLSKPIFPKGFLAKYPTRTGKLLVPFVKQTVAKSDAVEVLRKAQPVKKHAVRQPGAYVFSPKNQMKLSLNKRSKRNVCS